MFRAMFYPIIRRTWMYLQLLVAFTDVAVGWCHRWDGRQPTRCNNNGLLIIPASSTCFGQLFCTSSGALDCVTACGIMPPTLLLSGGRPATSWVHYITSCNTQSSAPEDGQNNCPKHVELDVIIIKPLLLHLVGCLLIFISLYFFETC